MEKVFDAVAVGELLVDFSCAGTSGQGNMLFEANPGGAPCNVLAMLSKLGRKTAFIGKVGDDFLGKMLIGKVSSLGIDTSCLYSDGSVNTTLAFIHNSSDGEREFSFYREPGADMMLSEAEISGEIIKKSKILHFGTLSMTHPKVASATRRAVDLAEKNGLILSFDPNLRFNLWKNEEDLFNAVSFGLAHCDILKFSDDELLWFTKESGLESGIARLKEKCAASLVILTCGKKGSRAFFGDVSVQADAFLLNGTVDTTGAGDCFCGCILNGVLENGLENLTKEKLSKMMRFASAAAALVTTKKGALCVMPGRDEINELLMKK